MYSEREIPAPPANGPYRHLRRGAGPRPRNGTGVSRSPNAGQVAGVVAAWALSCTVLAAPIARAQDPFADAIDHLDLGTNGGFNSELLPDVVLGPPRGTGLVEGSFDVLALGVGGEIVLRFDEPAICDGPGVDFTIFENAFHSGSPTGPIFDELGFVAVSEDGETFFEFPYDAETKSGLAGRGPVFSHPDNGISPLDPAVSGGDSFDLADVGLVSARYVRIVDVAGAIPDVGDLPPFLPAPNAGFDLDAVAAVNGCGTEPTASPTATASPPAESPTAAATSTATATISAAPATSTAAAATSTPTEKADTATSTPVPTEPSPATPGLAGDIDGNGVVDDGDVRALIGEIFDGDDEFDPRADVNGDLRITAADLGAISAQRGE